MNMALEKSLTFIIFIGIGWALRSKFKHEAEISGLKTIILNLALPATIFIALLKIQFDGGLFLLPVLALLLNALLFFASPLILAWIGISKENPAYRTSRMLIPSLAPGLSCFPFILEFLGDEFLAKAAMADLGNKLFVLFILYIVALNWHNRNPQMEHLSLRSRIKTLARTMVTEPVNLFIFAALALMAIGIHEQQLPNLIVASLSRLSLIMTPLVLLFIGLSVKFSKGQFGQIFTLLILRAALVLFVAGLFVWMANITLPQHILLTLCFALSACSFWPFAHIAMIENKEQEKQHKTFDSSFAVAILALSLPLSVVLILAVLTAGATFTSPIPVFILASGLLAVGLLPSMVTRIKHAFTPVPAWKKEESR